MSIKVAINGFGRIGRNFLKRAIKKLDLDVVAVNDLGDIENMAYLLRYDTVYGKSGLDIKVKASADGLTEQSLVIDGKNVIYLSEKDPSHLPWKSLGIDVVVESTGLFASFEKSKAHLDAGAKRVVISAPAKDTPECQVEGATVLMGINEDLMSKVKITSNASCTTNAAAPFMAVLDEKIGIEKAIFNTVYGYTTSPNIFY